MRGGSRTRPLGRAAGDADVTVRWTLPRTSLSSAHRKCSHFSPRAKLSRPAAAFPGSSVRSPAGQAARRKRRRGGPTQPCLQAVRRPGSVREGGAGAGASSPPSLAFPAGGRRRASVSLFLIFSPSPSFFFFSFPPSSLPPFPLGGASPGQGPSRSHSPPLPGPRRPMERGSPLPTRAQAAAGGAAGPAVAASGPGAPWN